MRRLYPLALLLASCGEAKPAENPEIEFGLFAPISQIKGYAWACDDSGRPLKTVAIEGPCKLKIRLPGGRELRLPGRSLRLSQNNSVLSDCSLRYSSDSADIPAAVASCQALAAELGLGDNPKIREFLRGVAGQDAAVSYQAIAPLDGKVKACLLIFPARDDRKAWAVSVVLSSPD